MVNALIAYYTNRQRRNSTAAANASSDEIDGGIHGEQDLDGESPNEIDRLYQLKPLYLSLTPSHLRDEDFPTSTLLCRRLSNDFSFPYLF